MKGDGHRRVAQFAIEQRGNTAPIHGGFAADRVLAEGRAVVHAEDALRTVNLGDGALDKERKAARDAEDVRIPIPMPAERGLEMILSSPPTSRGRGASVAASSASLHPFRIGVLQQLRKDCGNLSHFSRYAFEAQDERPHGRRWIMARLQIGKTPELLGAIPMSGRSVSEALYFLGFPLGSNDKCSNSSASGESRIEELTTVKPVLGQLGFLNKCREIEPRVRVEKGKTFDPGGRNSTRTCAERRW